ncbi:TonB C-terminal domain-containing protein [Hyalangium versicolor]|uniref:TonB C-terminal domain-containing protein n=1 Tax=Hyalangium versicolor TaxID=2861190 RepID=UPI001CCB670D|nr:TonB C-terminal domain-containing protein [Hyalangium versicolor]
MRPEAPPPPPSPLVVEVISSPPEPPAPSPAPPPAAPVRPVRPRPTPRPPPPALARPTPPPREAAEPPAQPAPAPSPPSQTSPAPDAPLAEQTKRPSLVPPTPSGGWSLPETVEAPRGRTLHPDDPSLAPEVLAAEEKARVTERVQTFVEDELAQLRVENGLVHPYFSEIRTALEKQMEKPPLFDVKGNSQRLAQSYVKRAQQYGATGTLAPSRTPKGPLGREPPTASERFESISHGNPAHDSMRAFFQAGEAMQELAEPAPDLVIVLELQQAADGQLRSVQVVQPSGNKAFDAYVLDSVPPALARLTPPPENALGVHKDGVRSLWAVEGRVVYLRHLKELEGQDTWYLASAAALGVLSGRFEETTGDLYVIDLRNPKFVCRPRLMKVW